MRAFGAREVRRFDLGDRHAEFERMDGQLGLDLEAAGQAGKALHEAAREHPVAGQDVREGAPEQLGQKSGQDAIAETMSSAVRGLLLIDARRDHHVEVFLAQPRDQLRRARRVIGAVAIDQHVDVGGHVGEHAPHHVALALPRLAPDDGARRARDLDGPVGWSCCRRRRSRHAAAPRGSPPPSSRSRPPR